MGSGEPVVLQLRSWHPSYLQINLSEYSDAYLSPSRKLLLLRSYSSEALLIPLSIDSGEQGELNKFGSEEAFSGRPCSLQESASPSESCNECLQESQSDSLAARKYSVIADVKSITWAQCKDSYHVLEESFIRELLVACGDHGVTVHCFYCKHEQDIDWECRRGQAAIGRWVEWSTSFVFHLNTMEEQIGDIGNHATGADLTSNRWLKTFLVDVNTTQHKDELAIKLPEQSLLPMASIVSFDIDFNTPLLLDFLSLVDVKNGEKRSCTCTDFGSNNEMPGVNAIFKCYHVFSGSAHCLIGFVLEVREPQSPTTEGICFLDVSRKVVAVATACWWGVEWLSSVPLSGLKLGPSIEWSDFHFCDSLLICLSKSGLICLWNAMTGQILADVFLSLSCESQFLQCPKGNRTEFSQLVNEAPVKRNFKKLMATRSSSLLAIVDDFGLVYVICVHDCIPQSDYLQNKLLPHLLCDELGVLAGWDIAASGIGSQRNPFEMSAVEVDGSCHCILNQNGFKQKIDQKFHGNRIKVEHSSSQSKSSNSMLPMQSNIARRVFFPLYPCGEGSSICFSSLGVTWLIKRPGMNESKDMVVVHMPLFHKPTTFDDYSLPAFFDHGSAFLNTYKAFNEGAIGCTFEGFLYLISRHGLFVVLPLTSMPTKVAHTESLKPEASDFYMFGRLNRDVEIEKSSKSSPAGEMDMLSKTIVHEGQEEAEFLCLLNGWNMTIARMHCLRLALSYMRLEEINQSLEMLADVNMAEEGVLQVVFTSVCMLFPLNGNANGAANSLRLLALAIRFTTKMIKRYGMQQRREEGIQCSRGSARKAKDLNEMAYFLEIMRKLQQNLNGRLKKDGYATEYSSIPESQYHVQQGYSHDLASVIPSQFTVPLKASLNGDSSEFNLVEVESSAVLVQRRYETLLENPKDMIARWKIENLDLKAVVRMALQMDRLPLAVLQLHLQNSEILQSEYASFDSFNKIREMGRALVYDLFLKGRMALAVTTLQRLGEDVTSSLKELVFGSVRRNLRRQIVEETKIWEYLGPLDRQILEQIFLIERLYESNSFWATFFHKQKQLVDLPPCSRSHLQLSCIGLCNNFTIECGEIDGIVLGLWDNLEESTPCPLEEAGSGLTAGYWDGAAVWCDAWDERTFGRIVLDRPSHMGIHILWESQFEYHVYHNDWEEVLKLLHMIPAELLRNKSILISLNGLRYPESVDFQNHFPNFADYSSSSREVGSVSVEVPNSKVLKFSISDKCSTWLKMLIEEELAKKLIFMKEYWEGSDEIVALLARIGFLNMSCKGSNLGGSADSRSSIFDDVLTEETRQSFHRIVIHYCSLHNLPNLLDLYLEHHKVITNDTSLLEAAGNFHWAKWLLLSRVNGCEYDASLSNAWATSIGVPKIDEIIHTVDDIAEGGGEMAALGTLIYAPVPIQNCLYSGSINRNIFSTAQCTLENLRPPLQQFPTLWRALVSACFGKDLNDPSLSVRANSGLGKSMLSDYLDWREGIFSSAGGDTSLAQILPCWFPRSVRRLVQIFVQGPYKWETLTDMAFEGKSSYVSDARIGSNGAVALSWEAAIYKNIEEELFVSSFKESIYGLEHYLHRGRAFTALYHLLKKRVSKLKSTHARHDQNMNRHVQINIQSDVQTLLAPLHQEEESILLSVIPLGISNYDNPLLVASCAFFLELCGLSAGLLHIDVAALCRISSFYKSAMNEEKYNLVKDSSLHPISHKDPAVAVARALADIYTRSFYDNVGRRKDHPCLKKISKDSSVALHTVLQQLELASMPAISEGKTCGAWLKSGGDNGIKFRSQQKAASQYWGLVTNFCKVHHLTPSAKYLAFLARDNDWVGFLREAQITGFGFDVVFNIASNEFSDPRLKTHILNVLRSLPPGHQKAFSIMGTRSTDTMSVAAVSTPELFGLLADIEKQSNAGEALLLKARDLHWSLLAVVASCFPDVSILSCMTIWLEITAARETSSIKVRDTFSKVAMNIGAAIDANNKLPACERASVFRYNRRIAKRRCLAAPMTNNAGGRPFFSDSHVSETSYSMLDSENSKETVKIISDHDEMLSSLSRMVAVLCSQQLFLPLLRAFELFLPTCALLPFIRFLQAFSHMRLADSSNHLSHFSSMLKEERHSLQTNQSRDSRICSIWIRKTAIEAADMVLLACPSPYEKRCLLQLLCDADFCDGGRALGCFRRLYCKTNIVEPSLWRENELCLGSVDLDDDAALLDALEKSCDWELARSWAQELEPCNGQTDVHHVTEAQAESMVAEWKEFLWDVSEERACLWGHCQRLFVRHQFPALKAGLFFLRHAEALENDVPARELHEMLLLSLQWLTGYINTTNPLYPLHLLREIESRVWLLAVEAEEQVKTDIDCRSSENGSNIIEYTATLVTAMENHLCAATAGNLERVDSYGSSGIIFHNIEGIDASFHMPSDVGSSKLKRRAKWSLSSRRLKTDAERRDGLHNTSSVVNSNAIQMPIMSQQEIDCPVPGWAERVSPLQLERAVLSLLEFGQVAAAKQVKLRLSSTYLPPEFTLIDAAFKVATTQLASHEGDVLSLPVDPETKSIIQSHNISDDLLSSPIQVLEAIATCCVEGHGRGLCKRIIAVRMAANVLGITFSEAFEKKPVELLQLLSLKAQDSFEAAKLLVDTHRIHPVAIAQVLAESFLKGLLAAHRGGYIDSQKEEGPAPLLWRFSDFLKWAELCLTESEVGHALMRLVITGQEVPHACEVELLILSHHFYKSSACLDGMDVLVALAATRVESYVAEGDFSCLARLVIGVGNFNALNFIFSILIENNQLELLLHMYSGADTTMSTADAVRGFRMAILVSLKRCNPWDHDALAMVYNHFDMKHETASLLEARAAESIQHWFYYYRKVRNEYLLDAMRFFIEAARVYATVDAGNRARKACAQASLLSLQIRMPDSLWLNLSETNARRALVDQSRFQEALIVAEAYSLNHPTEWTPVLWNQMFKPEVIEQFVAEYIAVLPLQPSMLLELAKFYRSEMVARGDQSQFSVWLSPGGLPAEWAKHLARSFKCLLKRTRDLRLRLQLAMVATGFKDVVNSCNKVLDKVPEGVGPLVLRRGHGGAYLPLM